MFVKAICSNFHFDFILNHFTLYSRSYCHLCDDMLTALQALSKEFVFKISVVDVDTDQALTAQYDELVPVLVGSRVGEERVIQLCHYFLDVEKVRTFLLGSDA
jgi:thiol-disulfide isomerase/thioredoxin